MSNLLSAPRGELLKLVYELVEENQALKIKIAELQEKLKVKDEGKGKPNTPSFVKPSVKRKGRTVRKGRVVGYGRKLDTPTHHKFHSFDACPDCGGNLGKPSVWQVPFKLNT